MLTSSSWLTLACCWEVLVAVAAWYQNACEKCLLLNKPLPRLNAFFFLGSFSKFFFFLSVFDCTLNIYILVLILIVNVYYVYWPRTTLSLPVRFMEQIPQTYPHPPFPSLCPSIPPLLPRPLFQPFLFPSLSPLPPILLSLPFSPNPAIGSGECCELLQWVWGEAPTKMNLVHFKWKIWYLVRIILVTFIKNYIDLPLSVAKHFSHSR